MKKNRQNNWILHLVHYISTTNSEFWIYQFFHNFLLGAVHKLCRLGRGGGVKMDGPLLLFLKGCNLGLWGRINSRFFSVLISIKSFYQIVEYKQILKKIGEFRIQNSGLVCWHVMNKILVRIPTGILGKFWIHLPIWQNSDRKIKKYQSKMK